jgi:hypothetical protein
MIKSETEIALQLLNLITSYQECTREIKEIIFKRTDIKDYSTNLRIFNATERVKNEAGQRKFKNLRILDRIFVRLFSQLGFDIETGFKVSYAIEIGISENVWTLRKDVWLLVTKETPLGDPWSVKIETDESSSSNLVETEVKIHEWLQEFLEHAKDFDLENPLKQTPCESIYSRIKSMFVEVKWNQIIAEDRNGDFYSESPDLFAKFDNEVNSIRHEVYALQKLHEAKES